MNTSQWNKKNFRVVRRSNNEALGGTRKENEKTTPKPVARPEPKRAMPPTDGALYGNEHTFLNYEEYWVLKSER